LNISETVRDKSLVPEDCQQEMPVGNPMVTWPITSRDLERSSRDPNMLRAQYVENSWRYYLATIANYKIVCCEAVRLAILATACRRDSRFVSHWLDSQWK